MATTDTLLYGKRPAGVLFEELEVVVGFKDEEIGCLLYTSDAADE